jgi:hypothetical protein
VKEEDIKEVRRALYAATSRHKKSMADAKAAYEHWTELNRDEMRARDAMLDLFVMADTWATTGTKPALWDAFANDLPKPPENG